MTNPLDNWEQGLSELLRTVFVTKEVPSTRGVQLIYASQDDKTAEEFKSFISTLLQAQREKERQRILELIVTNYTQSGYGDLIPADWEGFKKEILNQSNNNEESH